MANKYVKRCSTLLIIWEMQIKTTMRYHLTLVRTAIIKKSTNNKFWRDVEKRGHSCTVGGNVNWYGHYGRPYGNSLQTRNKTTIWPSNPIPRHIPWGNQNWKRHVLITTLFTIARTWKQPRYLSTDEWMKKLGYIYRMEYYSAIKKKTFESVLIRWMNLEPIIQSEVSQKEKDKYILTHIYEI